MELKCGIGKVKCEIVECGIGFVKCKIGFDECTCKNKTQLRKIENMTWEREKWNGGCQMGNQEWIIAIAKW